LPVGRPSPAAAGFPVSHTVALRLVLQLLQFFAARDERLCTTGDLVAGFLPL
jgi:hypothetical protein